MKTTKLTALLLAVILLVSVFSVLSILSTAALVEGDWIPRRSWPDYTEENATSYKPAAGYYYDSEGFHTVQQDTNDISVFTNVVTKESYSLTYNNDQKNGHVMSVKFRIDDFSYGGENNADEWIAVSVKNKQDIAHGDTTEESGKGLVILNRGTGDGKAQCLPHVNDVNVFGSSASDAITAELDSQGREIYTFTLDYADGKWSFAMNGHTYAEYAWGGKKLNDIFNSFEDGQFYFAITLNSSVKAGTGRLTILEFNGEVPYGEDSADPEENINWFAEIADASTVEANQPAVLWDAAKTSVSKLTGMNNTFKVNPADNTVLVTSSATEATINFGIKNTISYDGKDFPCFAMLTRNVSEDVFDSGYILWWAAGEVMSADNEHAQSELAFDDETIGGWNLAIYELDPEIDDFQGRINSLRVDFHGFDVSDPDTCTFKVGFMGMFRNAEEAQAYANSFVSQLAVDPDDPIVDNKGNGDATTDNQDATTADPGDDGEATTTAAPNGEGTTAENQSNNNASEQNGCGSVLATFSVIAVVSLGVCVLRKKD